MIPITNNIRLWTSFTLSLRSVHFFIGHLYVDKLTELRKVSSVGPNGLSGDFLFNIKCIISSALYYLFCWSINEGIFPNMWKICSIILILKRYINTMAENYRPIFSIFSHISKCFESLVLKYIMHSINSIIMENQYSVRPERSTTACDLIFLIIYLTHFRSKPK